MDDVAGSICESIMCGYADAERSARKCVKLDPDFAKGYGRLGEALRLQKNTTGARRALRQGLDRCQAGAYTRPIFSLTWAVLITVRLTPTSAHHKKCLR